MVIVETVRIRSPPPPPPPPPISCSVVPLVHSSWHSFLWTKRINWHQAISKLFSTSNALKEQSETNDLTAVPPWKRRKALALEIVVVVQRDAAASVQTGTLGTGALGKGKKLEVYDMETEGRLGNKAIK